MPWVCDATRRNIQNEAADGNQNLVLEADESIPLRPTHWGNQ
jgi:hypothetical protein